MIPAWLRILFWAAAASLGGAQTWYGRHRMFSDGVSYITIAQQYAAGDWHAALNAYWSPLYSWLIAIYLALFHPSQYWEAASLHVINFAAFLLGCFFFEKLLLGLIRQRPANEPGFWPITLATAGYVSILQSGLRLIGTGYDSPDMLAYCLIAWAAWLTLKLFIGNARTTDFFALGAVLGLGYLSRAAFAPLGIVYLVSIGLLAKKPRPMVVSLAGLVLVAAPFGIALSIHHGSPTIGESGKLNYGWEVDGAARTTHWQGEPGNIGTPAHPTRLILRQPVPVYEFGQPVAGAYPPWYDPSYWYAGIQPHLELSRQLRALLTDIATSIHSASYLAAFWVVALALALTLGRAAKGWPRPLYAALAIPAAAGIAEYCLVFVERRYIAGFVAVIGLVALSGAVFQANRLGQGLNFAAQFISAAFFLYLIVRLGEPLSVSAGDLLHHREQEGNVAWMLAQEFKDIGVKPGDRIAYIGLSIDADWVRMDGAKIVAEVPVTYDRVGGILNYMLVNYTNPQHFFALDQPSREKVYAAFRQSGAVLAVANAIPENSARGEWARALDPHDPKYPHTDAQIITQATTYYHWLVPPPAQGTR